MVRAAPICSSGKLSYWVIVQFEMVHLMSSCHRERVVEKETSLAIPIVSRVKQGYKRLHTNGKSAKRPNVKWGNNQKVKSIKANQGWYSRTYGSAFLGFQFFQDPVRVLV